MIWFTFYCLTATAAFVLLALTTDPILSTDALVLRSLFWPVVLVALGLEMVLCAVREAGCMVDRDEQ